MKFVNYTHDRREQLGILRSGGVMPLPDKSTRGLNSMLDLIENFKDDWIEEFEKRMVSQDQFCLPSEQVKFHAPIPFPRRNVFCLGKNYADHALEIRIAKISDTGLPDQPIYFTKTACPAIGHGDLIKFDHRITNQVDYEVELAVVIGKDGINIGPEQAEDHIFGYTIVNDVSARDLQAERKQWFKGKSLDTFCPMGPVLVHKSCLPLPLALNIQCRVNGEVRQNSNTSNLLFDIPAIISDLSQGLTLKAGDIICTGTPSGVGMGFDPPIYLTDGDVVECYIEKIGSLINRVVVV